MHNIITHDKRELRYQAILIGIATLLVVGALSVAAPPAHAAGGWYFCKGLDLAPGETCPPRGESRYMHLELTEGWETKKESHAVCIDDYLTELAELETNGFTTQKCVYYSGEIAYQPLTGQYGYPRAWNGGTVTHDVSGEEYGY